MLLIILLITLSTLFIYLYNKRIRSFNYWRDRGFPTLDEKPHWFFGNFGPYLLGRKPFVTGYEDAHREFKRRGHKIGGMYWLNLPLLLVTDNELMKRMLQTDFDSFADRGIAVDPIHNPLSMNLFALDGDPWTKIRKKLSPTFTSGKIKMMCPIVEQHIDVLIKVMRNLCKNGQDIDFQPWIDKTGIDVIGHVAFGLDCNTLESENEHFYEMTHRIMRPKLWKALKTMLFNFKNPADIITLLSSDQEMSDFFIKVVSDTVAHRRKNNIKANDFLQLLIEMIEEEEKKSGSGLTMLESAAQAFVFFVAGFETSAKTVLFALYALAKDQNEQKLVRKSMKKDMDAAKGLYEYDWLTNNERLDMVIKETLRLYSPVIGLNRMSTRDYKIDELNLTIPKRTCVVFSTFGFQRDPEFFEDPLEFRPERFSKENVGNIPPFSNIPFGDGPRFCIGKRFGYLQSKMMLAKILMNFEVTPGKLTEYPLKISPVSTNLLLTPEKPLYFNFKPIQT